MDEPISMEEALASDDKKKWEVAINDELSSMGENNSCEVAPKPKDCRIVQTKRIFKTKVEPDESVRFKARLVVKGYTQ